MQERLLQILQMLQMNTVGQMRLSLAVGVNGQLDDRISANIYVLDNMDCDTKDDLLEGLRLTCNKLIPMCATNMWVW